MELGTWFQSLPPEYIYAAFFVVLAVEGTGVPGVPFEPLYLAAGYLIGKGELSYWLAVLFGSVGNLVGNLLGYWFGASPAMKFLMRLFRRSKKPAGDSQKWRRLLERYGPGLVVLARWFGPIRTVTILGAGAAGMNFWSYLIFSAIGAFTWVAAWQLVFWQFTGLTLTWWERYRNNHQFFYAMAATILVFGLTALFIWRRRQRFAG